MQHSPGRACMATGAHGSAFQGTTSKHGLLLTHLHSLPSGSPARDETTDVTKRFSSTKHDRRCHQGDREGCCGRTQLPWATDVRSGSPPRALRPPHRGQQLSSVDQDARRAAVPGAGTRPIPPTTMLSSQEQGAGRLHHASPRSAHQEAFTHHA